MAKNKEKIKRIKCRKCGSSVGIYDEICLKCGAVLVVKSGMIAKKYLKSLKEI